MQRLEVIVVGIVDGDVDLVTSGIVARGVQQEEALCGARLGLIAGLQ